MTTRLSMLARHAATSRLVEAHKEEFADLYDEEREARGLPGVKNRKMDRIKKLRAELERLEDKG